MRLKANAAFVTDTGRLRTENQDAARIAQNSQTQWPVFVVADGMGGHAGGEVAAGLAVQALVDVVSDPAGPTDPDERLRAAIGEAERRIQAAIDEDQAHAGMGTTCVVALLDGHRLHLGHVGDSRAYLYRDGHLEQLTSDHSWVNEQVQSGLLAPAEAARHPMRHVITRALGPAPAEPDLIHRDLQPGDWLLLCTDGLTGPVDDETIARTLAEANHPEVAARQLVELANQAGGPDNITALLVHLETVDPAPAAAPASRRISPGHPWLIGLAIGLVALAIAIGAFFLLRPPSGEAPTPSTPVPLTPLATPPVSATTSAPSPAGR